MKKYKFGKLFQAACDLEGATEEKRRDEERAADLVSSGLEPEKAKRPMRLGRETFLLTLEHLVLEIKNKTCLSYLLSHSNGKVLRKS
jgi:hypothetical protein